MDGPSSRASVASAASNQTAQEERPAFKYLKFGADIVLHNMGIREAKPVLPDRRIEEEKK